MENIFTGKPSFILEHRPFFSIIIPCYNSKKTIGNLLESIVSQNMDDDLEVILSDDCSTESYQEIVEQYKYSLSIKQIQTDYNFAPGNTREKGVSIAEGEWILFADHDDVFFPETLSLIKEELLTTGEKYYAIANFVEADPETGTVIREMRGTRNWNHAKFYNLDNFWKAYNIHFKKDLLTHEDIYISSTVNCIIEDISEQGPLFIDVFCYIWNSRPTSVSREKYGNHPFLETFFQDYVDATGNLYMDMLEQGKTNNFEYILYSSIEVLLFCYFYYQGFVFHDPENYIRENDDICRNYLVRIKETFGIDNNFIWNYCAENDAEMFTGVKKSAFMASGPYIENETFRQWLNRMHKDITPRVTMSESMNK